MIRAVLFDLDGTLLDIDVDSFIETYTRSLAAKLVPEDQERGLAVLAGSTYAMLAPEVNEDSNQVCLLRKLSDALDRSPAELWRSIHQLSKEILPGLKEMAKPITGAAQVVREIHERGLKVVVATMPIYPRDVMLERLRWAGVRTDWVDHVACLEANRSAKPHRSYFLEMADAVGAAAEECLMVGDDEDQDMPALDAGMAVHLVQPPRGRPEPTGRLRFGDISQLGAVWADALA